MTEGRCQRASAGYPVTGFVMARLGLAIHEFWAERRLAIRRLPGFARLEIVEDRPLPTMTKGREITAGGEWISLSTKTLTKFPGRIGSCIG